MGDRRGMDSSMDSIGFFIWAGAMDNNCFLFPFHSNQSSRMTALHCGAVRRTIIAVIQ